MSEFDYLTSKALLQCPRVDTQAPFCQYQAGDLSNLLEVKCLQNTSIPSLVYDEDTAAVLVDVLNAHYLKDPPQTTDDQNHPWQVKAVTDSLIHKYQVVAVLQKPLVPASQQGNETTTMASKASSGEMAGEKNACSTQDNSNAHSTPNTQGTQGTPNAQSNQGSQNNQDTKNTQNTTPKFVYEVKPLYELYDLNHADCCVVSQAQKLGATFMGVFCRDKHYLPYVRGLAATYSSMDLLADDEDLMFRYAAYDRRAWRVRWQCYLHLLADKQRSSKQLSWPAHADVYAPLCYDTKADVKQLQDTLQKLFLSDAGWHLTLKSQLSLTSYRQLLQQRLAIALQLLGVDVINHYSKYQERHLPSAEVLAQQQANIEQATAHAEELIPKEPELILPTAFCVAKQAQEYEHCLGQLKTDGVEGVAPETALPLPDFIALNHQTPNAKERQNKLECMAHTLLQCVNKGLGLFYDYPNLSVHQQFFNGLVRHFMQFLNQFEVLCVATELLNHSNVGMDVIGFEHERYLDLVSDYVHALPDDEARAVFHASLQQADNLTSVLHAMLAYHYHNHPDITHKAYHDLRELLQKQRSSDDVLTQVLSLPLDGRGGTQLHALSTNHAWVRHVVLDADGAVSEPTCTDLVGGVAVVLIQEPALTIPHQRALAMYLSKNYAKFSGAMLYLAPQHLPIYAHAGQLLMDFLKTGDLASYLQQNTLADFLDRSLFRQQKMVENHQQIAQSQQPQGKLVLNNCLHAGEQWLACRLHHYAIDSSTILAELGTFTKHTGNEGFLGQIHQLVSRSGEYDFIAKRLLNIDLEPEADAYREWRDKDSRRQSLMVYYHAIGANVPAKQRSLYQHLIAYLYEENLLFVPYLRYEAPKEHSPSLQELLGVTPPAVPRRYLQQTPQMALLLPTFASFGSTDEHCYGKLFVSGDANRAKTPLFGYLPFMQLAKNTQQFEGLSYGTLFVDIDPDHKQDRDFELKGIKPPVPRTISDTLHGFRPSGLKARDFLKTYYDGYRSFSGEIMLVGKHKADDLNVTAYHAKDWFGEEKLVYLTV